MAMDVALKTCKAATCEMPGTSTRADRGDFMDVSFFKEGLVIPKHLLTKKNAGEKQHKAIEFELEVDQNTPLWAQCACKSDTIESMEFYFHHINDVGVHEAYFKITLNGCQISAFDIGTGFGADIQSSRQTSDYDSREKLRLAVVFDSITWEHLVGTVTMAQDSWTGKF